MKVCGGLVYAIATDFIFRTNKGRVSYQGLAEKLAGDEDIQPPYLAV